MSRVIGYNDLRRNFSFVQQNTEMSGSMNRAASMNSERNSYSPPRNAWLYTFTVLAIYQKAAVTILISRIQYDLFINYL